MYEVHNYHPSTLVPAVCGREKVILHHLVSVFDKHNI
jgi:hypothetical protein